MMVWLGGTDIGS